jgi:hypothetical protein
MVITTAITVVMIFFIFRVIPSVPAINPALLRSAVGWTITLQRQFDECIHG